MAKNKGGRPVKYKTAQDLQKVVDSYFKEIEDYNKQVMVQFPLSAQQFMKHPSVTGLALALDMRRRTLIDYTEKGDEFSHTIKRAKAKVEAYLEQRLF